MSTASYKILTSTSQKSSLFRFNSNLLNSNLLKFKSKFSDGTVVDDDALSNTFSSGFLPDSEFVISKNDHDFIFWRVNSGSSSTENLVDESDDSVNTDVTLVKLPFARQEAVRITFVAAGKKSNRYVYVACTTNSAAKISNQSAANSGEKSFILIWDRKDEKYLSNIIHVSGPVHRMVLTTDDQKLAAAISNTIAIHSVKHNTTTYLENPFDGPITCLDFYPFKKSVLVAGGKDGSIAVWDLNNSSTPNVVKKRIHASSVTAVCFAPCNKHFYCSASLDKMVHFHDINSPPSSKGLLQSYQAEFPLLSLSINDDHTVAIGDAKGHVLIYDLRQKQLIHTIDTESNDAIYCLSFQPPKWSITAAIKDQTIYDTSKRVITPKTDQVFEKLVSGSVCKSDGATLKTTDRIPPVERSNLKTSESSSSNVMDIFSPVNKGRIIQPKTTTGASDLRRAATLGLFNEKLKNVKTSLSVEQLPIPSASVQIEPSPSMRIAKSADKLGSPIDLSASSSEAIQVTDLTETVASLKKDLDQSSASFEMTAEEQTPTQKQPQQTHVPKDTGTKQREQIRPPQAPTPISSFFGKTPSVPQVAIEAITDESVKRVGGLIGQNNAAAGITMTPSAYLKSSINISSQGESGHEGEQVTSFQYKVIREIVEDVVQNYHEQIRRDVQNLHVEIIKQFTMQKIEFERMLEHNLPTRDMMDLLETMQEENDRLRRNF